MNLTISRTISAPVADVFRRMADIPNLAATFSSVVRTEMLTPGPVGVGTKWNETRSVNGKQGTQTVWISDLAKDERLVIETEAYGWRFRMLATFSPANQDKTNVTVELSAKAGNLLAKALTGKVQASADTTRALVEQDLDDLERAVRS